MDLSANKMTASRGPVSWGALGLVAVAAASAVSYYQIERERRLEEAMGKIVSSESEGWSPVPSQLAPRKWKQNKGGEWFPIVNDVWGAGTVYLVDLPVDRDRDTFLSAGADDLRISLLYRPKNATGNIGLGLKCHA